MFIEILRESSKLLKKNLNLAQLIFIFFILMTFFSSTIMGAKFNIRLVPSLILWGILIAAFFAGLFFAFKKAIEYETEPPKTNNDLPPLYFAEFFQGAGAFTLKFALAGIFLLFLVFLLGFGYDYFVTHYVVLPESFKNLTTETLMSNAKMTEFANSLSIADAAKLGKLSLMTFAIMGAFGYLTMLYPMILVREEHNFFKSFFVSIKYLFKDFFVSLILFLFFNIVLAMAGFISMAVASNIILSVFIILLQCYFNVWYILSMFVYYEKVK